MQTALNHQLQQPQTTPAEVHEPATTCSDITSIASQSPPHDTGQKHHYHSEISHIRLCEKLTNTSSPCATTTTITITTTASSTNMLDRHTIKATMPRSNRASLNDPDIIRDLGKQNRGSCDDYAWQRSASCKELGQLQPAVAMERLLKTDAMPAATRSRKAAQFDSFGHCYSCHGQSAPFTGGIREQVSAETKVYSSSYPGTTPHLSVESDDNPTAMVAGSNIYLMDNPDNQEESDNYHRISQDDLSHDSYELLEKEEIAAGVHRHSRSSSVVSDEMFIMENDYEGVSKYIFWREGSADVEKRLGYVEPRYRNIDFNEFNEICKRGFASRNRDASLSHGNIRFSEFSIGDKLEKVAAAHENVARTKSDPYMIRSSSHSSNRRKLFGLHQKSFDLAPSECYGGGGSSSGDERKYAIASKSTVDIPYTLRIRNAMNGTAREYTALADEGYGFDAGAGTLQSSGLGARCVAENEVRFKAAVGSDYAASQDSGLSLSAGTESVDDIDIDLKNVMLTKNSYEQVITSKKSTKLMLSLSEENNENVPPSGEKLAAPRTEVDSDEGAANSKGQLLAAKSTTDEKEERHIIKVKSVEVPKRSHSSGGGRVRKSRSAEACDRKSSFLRTDSGGSRGKKEIIVIDSDDYHSFDDSRSDKRSDGSDSVIIVEYRGSKKKKLSKKASSDSRGSQAESEASSFDAPRIKKKELKKRHSAHAAYFYKDRIPTIEISEDETFKAEAAVAPDQDPGHLQHRLISEFIRYSSDEHHASGSDLSKTEVINELMEDNTEGVCVLTECGTSQELCDELVALDEDGVEPEECTLAETADSASGRFMLAHKISPILTRLGLSEGSATSQLTQKLLPSSSARRAKSLDTPIVSLHRLPPITSFSSKDDTVDSEEVVAALEEKTSKCYRNKTASTESDNWVAGEQSVEGSTGAVHVNTQATEKQELKPKPTFIRSVSAAVTAFSGRKQSLDLRALTKKNDADNEYIVAEMSLVGKERSKSEGYDRKIELSKDLTDDRKHSTRQERLDSFKKLKNFSIELWESEEVDGKCRRAEITDVKEIDDNVFEESAKSLTVEVVLPASSIEENQNQMYMDQETNDTTLLQTTLIENSKRESESIVPLSPVPIIDEKASLRLDLVEGDKMTLTQNVIPEKRSFDDEPSTSSIKPEPPKMAGLESSGSSSVEEGMLPCDCGDEEELAQLPSVAAAVTHATLDASLTLDTFANPLSSPFNPSFFSLARTLSRISERSTTSEQERTTDMDDDSTKPLSRSLSIDDSILSSDQHPSFSSDPPSGMNLENVFDDDDAAAVIELDDDKLDFNIPPPLFSPEEAVDGDWPSPPCSPGSVKTPVIDDENYSAAPTTAVALAVSPFGQNSPLRNEAVREEGEEEAGSVSEDNKTLQDEDDVSELDDGKMYRKERTRGSIGDDTSAGLTTSDWSSSTGTTVKLANAVAGASTTAPSTASKSEDNSLAGECGLASLCTDAPTSADSLGRSSVNELAATVIVGAAVPFEKKYLTLDRKQRSADRKLIFFPPTFDSFDDEYDSPCTESEDTPSSPLPPHVFPRQQTPSSLHQPEEEQPPPPPRHFQDSTTTTAAASVAVASAGGGGPVMQKWRTKTERNRATKFAVPHYTSSSMSTSVESPTSAERKFAKMVAKAKCYSYYSLARSPPSDDSSSSPDAPETPLTPNTIPRVSKRRRVAAHSSTRRRVLQPRLNSGDEHHRGGDHHSQQHPHHHSASPSILASSGYKSYHHSRRSRY